MISNRDKKQLCEALTRRTLLLEMLEVITQELEALIVEAEVYGEENFSIAVMHNQL